MKRCKEEEHDPITFKLNPDGFVKACAKCKCLLESVPKKHGLAKDELHTLVEYHASQREKYVKKKRCAHDWVVHPDNVTGQKRCADCGQYPV